MQTCLSRIVNNESLLCCFLMMQNFGQKMFCFGAKKAFDALCIDCMFHPLMLTGKAKLHSSVRNSAYLYSDCRCR
ncbi:hypothetical protein V6Z11_A12G180100 [Gossypium hirsutum]